MKEMLQRPMPCGRHLNYLIVLAAVTGRLHAGVPSLAPGAEAASRLNGEVGITVANQYITRGFVVQDDGTLFQPYIHLNADLYLGDGFIHSVSTFLELWSAISSKPYSAEVGGNRFTEFDTSLGITTNFAKRWTFTGLYNRWTSPADAYEDGHWISAAIEFDDEGLIAENFALRPFFQIARDFNDDIPGPCFETGIAPSRTYFSNSVCPVEASLLIMVGLGNGYFAEDYGYFAMGPKVSLPLGFIDPSLGDWNFTMDCIYHDYGRLATSYNGKARDLLLSMGLTIGF